MLDLESLRPLVEPFIDKRPDGHWLWTGVRRKYSGVVKVKDKGTQSAARIVVFLARPGLDWDTTTVKRICDVQFCVNPACQQVTTEFEPFKWPAHQLATLTKEYDAR